MTKSVHPLEQVYCPDCNSSDIFNTCSRSEGDTRIRYKRCRSCGCRFKTEQLITREIVTPKKKSFNSKLREEDVVFIKEQLVGGIYGAKALALQYEVSQSCIFEIKAGRTWSHVTVGA